MSIQECIMVGIVALVALYVMYQAAKDNDNDNWPDDLELYR